jgi:hypothetical protein
MLTLYSPDNSKLMEVEALERRGNELLIKGKGLKLVNFKLALFLLTFLLR